MATTQTLPAITETMRREAVVSPTVITNLASAVELRPLVDVIVAIGLKLQNGVEAPTEQERCVTPAVYIMPN